jgi:hypothetical protein
MDRATGIFLTAVVLSALLIAFAAPVFPLAGAGSCPRPTCECNGSQSLSQWLFGVGVKHTSCPIP